MDKLMIKMVDGGMVNYRDDSTYFAGCETCDYGSEYITDIVITLTKYQIDIETNRMYEYALSEGDMLKILLSNYESIKLMTEKEFIAWLKFKLIETVGYEKILKKYDVADRR